jgi:hypothetical protein
MNGGKWQPKIEKRKSIWVNSFCQVLQGCWGQELNCRALSQAASPAKKCKNAFTKAEPVPKKTAPL